MKAALIGHQLGVHEARFIRAFGERDVEMNFIAYDNLAPSPDGSLLASKFADLNFIFGGPLHLENAFTPFLNTVPFIAVSYALDILHEAVNSSASRSNVSQMLEASRGLLVDCEVVAETARRDFGYTKPILVRAWGLENQSNMDSQTTTRIPSNSEMLSYGATVVSTRNFTKLHGILDVVLAFGKAASINPALRLVMAGDGPMRQQVVSTIHDLGISERVTLLGNIPESEMVALIRRANVYVSAALVDGTSISLLQALEAGVAVLLSNVGGNKEWAQRVEGADLFEVGDWEQLGNLINKKIGTQRFDRSAVLKRFADWQNNAEEIVRFCCSLAS